MPSFEQPWRPEIDWNTAAGRLLDQLVEALPSSRPWRIIVFGSSPLQLALDPAFLSGDVDIIPFDNIDEHLRAAGLLKGQAEMYVEPCTPNAFTAAADWTLRAFEVARRHVTFVLPHPIDILVSKIKRLEEKDLNAFRLVRARTGHPTEEDLIHALQRVVDLYRPSFDEESAGDPMHNTEVLWRELFNKSVDVRRQIIAPAIAERRKQYGKDKRGLRDRLGRLGESSEP